MARIAKFYERLPKGAAPDRATGGLFGRYQARYMGKNPSAARESSQERLYRSRPLRFDGMRLVEYRGSVANFYSGLAFDFQFDGSWLRLRVLLPLESVFAIF